MKDTTSDIAIIGIGCRFPKNIHSAKAYWQFLHSGESALTDIPANRWYNRQYYDPTPGKTGKLYVNQGYFLQNDIANFDAEFFNISPREASVLDPQQRHLLEVTWQAFEDASIPPSDVAGQEVGVYVGAMLQDYQTLQCRPNNRHLGETQSVTGMTLCALSNRISYQFNFTGPSLTIDTACSSSLTALHYAYQDLQQQRCTMAVCAGVNLMLLPEFTMSLCQGRYLALDGRSKAFSELADGYGRGEGTGAILLKPLTQAEADGDPIYAILCGSGLNQDGATEGFSLPSQASQERLLQQVYGRANIDPEQLQFVETHGTGTWVGDKTEAQALGQQLGQYRKDPLPLGAVKTQIGHLEAAAGIASIIKACLSLYHRQLPGHIQQYPLRQDINFNALNIYPASETLSLTDQELYAGVNGFGYGGSNAHIILKNYTAILSAQRTTVAKSSASPYLFCLSAHSKIALQQTQQRWLNMLAEQDIETTCYYANRRIEAEHYRAAFLIENKQQLQKHLKSTALAEINGHYFEEATVTVVFTGFTAFPVGTAQRYYQRYTEFRQIIDELTTFYQDYADVNLLELLWYSDTQQLTRMDHGQIGHFSLQIALYAQWRAWGLKIENFCGHSAGEVAAAVACGALSLIDGAKVAYHRGRLMEQEAGKGMSIVVAMNAEAAQLELEGTTIEIAAYNNPHTLVLSGNKTDITTLQKRLQQQKIFVQPLFMNYAAHHSSLTAIAHELHDVLADLRWYKPQTTWYSTVTATAVKLADIKENYWVKNTIQPVKFAQTFQQLLIPEQHQVILQLGPAPNLTFDIEAIAKAQKKPLPILYSIEKQHDDHWCQQRALAYSFCYRVPLDWTKIIPDQPLRQPGVMGLKPWQQQPYFVESQVSTIERKTPPEDDLLGHRLPTGSVIWQSTINQSLIPFLYDHQVQENTVFPGAGYLYLFMMALQQIDKENSYIDIDFTRLLTLDSESDCLIETQINEQQIQLYSCVDQEKQTWTLQSQGQIATAQPLTPISITPADHRYLTTYSLDCFYPKLAQIGLQYGQAFQQLEQVWLEDELIIVKLKQNNAHTMSLLDSVFQSILVYLLAQDRKNIPLTLPRKVATMSWPQWPEQPIWACIHIRQHLDMELLCDLDLYNEEHQRIAQMRGLLMQSIEQGQPETHYYEYRWQPWREISFSEHKTALFLQWQLVCAHQEYQQLAQTYLGCERSPSVTKGIIYWPDITTEQPTTTLIAECLQLVVQCAANEIPLWIITLDQQAIISGDHPQYLASASLWGIQRVANLEYSQLELKIIDLPRDDLRQTLPHLNNLKNTVLETEIEWAIRHNQLYVHRFKPIVLFEQYQRQQQLFCQTDHQLRLQQEYGYYYWQCERYAGPKDSLLVQVIVSPLGYHQPFYEYHSGQRISLSLQGQWRTHHEPRTMPYFTHQQVPNHLIGVSIVMLALYLLQEVLRIQKEDTLCVLLDESHQLLEEICIEYCQTHHIQQVSSMASRQANMIISNTEQLVDIDPQCTYLNLANKPITHLTKGLQRQLRPQQLLDLPNEQLQQLFLQAQDWLLSRKQPLLQSQSIQQTQQLITTKQPFAIKIAAQNYAQTIKQPIAMDSSGIYLITGGFTGVGVLIARWLVARGARHIALCGRRGKETPGAIALIKEFTDQGVKIYPKAVDISQDNEVQTLITTLTAQYPIKGVFHCAAVIHDQLIHQVTEIEIERGLLAKAQGAYWLDRYLNNDTLDHFVLCSSLTSVLGNVGQSVYAAANSYLDHLAWQRYLAKKPALSINLGAIANTGTVSGKELTTYLQQLGIEAITPAQLYDDLDCLLTLQDSPQVTLANLNWNQVPGIKQRRQFSQFHVHQQQNEQPMMATLTIETLQQHLIILIESCLNLDTGSIQIEQPLHQYGLDSIMALEISSAIEQELQLKVSLVDILQGKSIVQLAKKMLN